MFKKNILKVGVKNGLRHKPSLGHRFGILYDMGDVHLASQCLIMNAFD